MDNIFELVGKLIIDENKPTVLFVQQGPSDEYTYTYGAARVVIENIRDRYNIITIGAGCKLNNNYYQIQRDVTQHLLRKADDDEHKEKNDATIKSWLDNSFKDLPDIDYIILGTDDFFRLPLMEWTKKSDKELSGLYNEFFDYVGTDPDVINRIDDLNTSISFNWSRKVSAYAFSVRDCFWFMEMIGYMHKTNRLKKELIAFPIDPVMYTPYFSKLGIKSKFFYFADDTRGTRNFKQFDTSQLQHIIYDEKFRPKTINSFFDDEVEKTHNMFFAGTLFQDKGSRRFIWDKFLKDVTSDNCSYYIPLKKNGINKQINGRSERAETMLKETEEFTDLYNSVKGHANFKDSILPADVNDVTKKYKYGMIFRCVSFKDSLNFRPVLYAYLNIVPFIDPRYDPECLQIPSNIQAKLLVENSWDIDERIKYFNENDSARIEVINELRELFNIDQYINDPQTAINNQISKIFA